MKNFKTKEPVVETPKATRLGGSVKDYMATNLITFRPDTPILDAIATLVEKKISGAPVLNEKKEVVGMIDEKDCMRVLIERSYHSQPVRDGVAADYMDSVMRSISSKSDILDVANIFLETSYKRLLVVDKFGKLIGQISRSDALRAILDLEK
ncbi:MAG: CBS domain-containing protein [Lewinellaceae bacterium]|nr:CBS domain-containing protein [Lewinellaceae bacterium]